LTDPAIGGHDNHEERSTNKQERFDLKAFLESGGVSGKIERRRER
jgi:hypothetical protein